jgi:hypothetical protein
MDEKSLELLEREFPLLAAVAFGGARKMTLQSGLSVLLSEAGVIYEVFPDGSRRWVKKVEPPTQVVPGVKIIIW